MVDCACWMRLPATWTHLRCKTKSPDPVLGIGRSPKIHAFSAHRSFPSTGGLGISTQTLGPDSSSGPRPSSRGLSLRWAAGVGVTAIVYAARLRYAIEV